MLSSKKRTEKKYLLGSSCSKENGKWKKYPEMAIHHTNQVRLSDKRRLEFTMNSCLVFFSKDCLLGLQRKKRVFIYFIF
jgi:hypothetical protein